MQYRREIDGLRALAVLPVVFFHAGFGLISGGYVGVDVFFVISGYLITSIILADLAQGQFSLKSFYDRRVRRILPALTLVVLVCFPLAWFAMLPDDLENFGQSALATMLSLNNVLLSLTSGYWDLASEFKPLVHTWSLGVEEQFYIVFPLLMMAIYPRWRRGALGAVLLIVAASFAACLILSKPHPIGTFYLLHTRAWELGLGALGAFAEQRRRVAGNETLSLAGLALILASVMLFDSTTPHPSPYTIAPVLGTLLVLLFAREGTLAARLLGLPALVGVGLISYSLYLWHQPIFAFARILSLEEPSKPVFLALIALAILLAFLSWKYVEQPFRRRSFISTRRVVGLAVTAAVTLSAAGLAVHLGQGFPSRIFKASHEIAAGMHINYNYRIGAYDTPDFDPAGTGPRVLIIGNSQARDFANMLFENGTLTGKGLIYRPDLALCDYPNLPDPAKALVEKADVIFFPIIELTPACQALLSSGTADALNVVFVGPKHFGYNLNAFIRVPEAERPAATARMFDDIVRENRRNTDLIPAARYIDLIAAASADGAHIRVFDDAGQLISADRIHTTKAGAQLFGTGIRNHPSLAALR